MRSSSAGLGNSHVSMPRAQPAVQLPAIESFGRGARPWGGQQDRGHRADHALGTRRRDAERIEQHRARRERERAIARHQLRPAAGKRRAEVLQGGRDTQPRRGVTGAGPVELSAQAAPVAMADDRRMDTCVAVSAHVQKRRALRRAKPLVGIARIVGRCDAAQIERHHAGGMRAVDERIDAAGTEFAHQALDRQDERRRTGDVIHKREACPRRDGRKHCREHLALGSQRKRHAGRHHLRAGPRRHELRALAARAVGLTGQQQLITRLERERAQHRVHRGRGVRDEHHIGGIRTDEARERRARCIEPPSERSVEEIHRLALHLGAQARLRAQHRRRAGAEGAVVEVQDLRVELPERGEAIGRGGTVHAMLHGRTDCAQCRRALRGRTSRFRRTTGTPHLAAPAALQSAPSPPRRLRTEEPMCARDRIIRVPPARPAECE